MHHLDLTQRFLEIDGNLYSIDLVMAAVMSRSYSLVEGFIDAFDGWNLIVAAPLLRMQLDSLTRLAYIASAPRADEVAEYIIGGGEFRKLKDAENRRLTDARLIEHAEPTHPWVKDVYGATSGWVHFSPAHVVTSWQVKDNAKGGQALSGTIPIRAERIPVSMLKEVLGAMIKATEEIFGYVEAWESHKGLRRGRRESSGGIEPPAALRASSRPSLIRLGKLKDEVEKDELDALGRAITDTRPGPN